MLVGGVQKSDTEMRLRGESHLLLVGDPGLMGVDEIPLPYLLRERLVVPSRAPFLLSILPSRNREIAAFEVCLPADPTIGAHYGNWIYDCRVFFGLNKISWED